jgi:hypothetical protein
MMPRTLESVRSQWAVGAGVDALAHAEPIRAHEAHELRALDAGADVTAKIGRR